MHIFSILLSAALFFLCTIVLPVMYRVAKTYNLENEEDVNRFEALQSGFHYNGFISRHWNMINLSRHFFASQVLVLLRDYNSLQIIILFSSSILFQCLIFRAYPCDTRVDNGYLIFNEFMAILYLYVLLGITDFNLQDNFYDTLSFILAIIFIATFIINLLNIIFVFLKWLYKQIKKLCVKIFC